MNTAFSSLAATLQKSDVTLVTVSKTFPADRILEVYNEGCRIFGENRVQEMLEKYEVLPKDIKWHLIGHLQTNKIKYIAPFVDMIHSVDSLRLLQEIDKQAAKHSRTIDCLLQFDIADETTKFGLSETEAEELLASPEYASLHNIRICGVMGMATFTDDKAKIRMEFRHLKRIFDQLRERFFPNAPYFKEISMGMSGDWQIAVEEGSTMVRIGSLIFGNR